MGNLYQHPASDGLLPAPAKADTSTTRDFFSYNDPAQVPGTVLAVGDKWHQCGAPSHAPIVTPPGGGGTGGGGTGGGGTGGTGGGGTGGGGGGGTTLKPMLIGTSWSDYDNMDSQLVNLTGTKPGGVNSGMSARRYYQNSGFPATFAASGSAGDVNRPCASLWSFSDTSYVPTIASGSMNGQLTSFFASIPAGHRFYAIFWHEVDLHYRDFATYKQAFVNIRLALKNSGADRTRVKAGGLLTSGGFRAGDGDNYFDTNHDFVGIDFYEYYTDDPASPFYGKYQLRTPAYLAGAAVAKAKQLGIPIIVGEYGAHPLPDDPLSRPTRMKAAIAYCEQNNCEAFAYFNSQVGSRGPWWLDSYPNWTTTTDRSHLDPDSMAAYRDVLSTHVRFAEGA